jgi:hypothetical protein
LVFLALFEQWFTQHPLRKTVSETLILFFSTGEKEAVKAKLLCASSFFLKVVSVDDDDEKTNLCIFETISSLIDSSPGTPIVWALSFELQHKRNFELSHPSCRLLRPRHFFAAPGARGPARKQKLLSPTPTPNTNGTKVKQKSSCSRSYCSQPWKEAEKRV